MKTFVTGATGFIGRRLVDRLLREGLEVFALVRSQSHRLPPEVKTIQGDLLLPESLSSAGSGCDRLYHLAGMITFDPRKRMELAQVNGQGARNILAAARQWGVERTVVVSSACTMGLSTSANLVRHENSTLAEDLARSNPYLASKLLAEQAAYTAAQEQAVVIVNPTTVYGPGDFSLNSGTLILKIAQAPLMPIPPGGSNVVDVDDVVEGIFMAGERGASGQRYILGGANLRFAQIFETVAGVVNHRPLFVPLPAWMRHPMSSAAWLIGKISGSRFITPQIIGDMFAFKYYSSERARRDLGWTPQYAFQESVLRAWQFYQDSHLIGVNKA